MGDREDINNTDDLQCGLMAIRDSITLTQLHMHALQLFDDMPARMKPVVKRQGGRIGKRAKLGTMFRLLAHAIGVHYINEYTLAAIWGPKTSMI